MSNASDIAHQKKSIYHSKTQNKGNNSADYLHTWTHTHIHACIHDRKPFTFVSWCFVLFLLHFQGSSVFVDIRYSPVWLISSHLSLLSFVVVAVVIRLLLLLLLVVMMMLTLRRTMEVFWERKDRWKALLIEIKRKKKRVFRDPFFSLLLRCHF